MTKKVLLRMMHHPNRWKEDEITDNTIKEDEIKEDAIKEKYELIIIYKENKTIRYVTTLKSTQ